MKSLKRLLLASLLATVALPGPAALAVDFDMAELTWSYRGEIEGQHCIKIAEPSEPKEHAWHDNFLCFPEEYGLEWSYRGKKSGMVCTSFNEPAEPKEHHWGDNYLCAPEDYGLSFSNAGPEEGKTCLQIKEGSDPHTWNDNYLCGPDSKTNKVMGQIDGIGSNPLTVDGWACAYGNNSSIDVQLFAGGPIGEGRVIGGVRANRPSEPAIADKCGSNGSAHRFSIPITDSIRQANLGQTVWVYGVSPVKGANLLIEESGKYRLPLDVPNAPSVDDPDPYPGKKKNGSFFEAVEDRHRDPASDRDLSEAKLIGYVDGVSLSPMSVEGWACVTGSRNPPTVHIFAGGPVGIGKLLGQAVADRASEAAVGAACDTGYRYHRFEYRFKDDDIGQFAGEKIFVFGFSNKEGKRGYQPLKGNGTIAIPGESWFRR